MSDETQITAIDRLFNAFFGGVTGAVYGVALWLIAFYLTKASHSIIIVFSATVFSLLAVFFGNFLLEAFLGLLYFFWGMLSGAAGVDASEFNSDNHLRAFFLVGLGTSLVIGLWWHY